MPTEEHSHTNEVKAAPVCGFSAIFRVYEPSHSKSLKLACTIIKKKPATAMPIVSRPADAINKIEPTTPLPDASSMYERLW